MRKWMSILAFACFQVLLTVATINLGAQTAFSVDTLYKSFRKSIQQADTQAAWIRMQPMRKSIDPVCRFYYVLAESDSFAFRGKKEGAVRLSLETIEIAKKLQADSLVFKANYYAGDLFMSLDDLPRALRFFNECLLKIHSVKDSKDLISLYKDVALLYTYLGKSEVAIAYFLKIEPLARAMGNKKVLGNIYNNIGICYVDLRNYARARFYYSHSLAIRKEIDDKHGIAQVNNNLGSLHYESGQYDQALQYFLKGLELRKQAGVAETAIIESQINIGKTYYKLGKEKAALENLEQAREKAIALRHIELERRADEQLGPIYATQGNYRMAYAIQARYFELKDSLYGLSKKEEIGRLTFEGKLKADSLKNEEEQQRLRIAGEKEQVIRNISIIGFALALLVAFVLFVQVKKIRYANRIIAQQKDMIEIRQKDMLDGIMYASRIQQSQLASEIYIDKALKRLMK